MLDGVCNGAVAKFVKLNDNLSLFSEENIPSYKQYMAIAR